MLQCLAGSAGIVLVLFIFRDWEINIVIRIIVKICASAIVYFVLQIITKNRIVIDLLDNALKKINMNLGGKVK